MSYKERNGVSPLIVLKGSVISVLFAVSVIALFALFVKIFTIPQTAIKYVNQFIKLISILVGCLFSVKGEYGFIKGALIGALFTFFIYSLFSVISVKSLFDSSFWLDVILCSIVGFIVGIITVNVKNKN